ncbi:MAG: TauD/TfdA family dioxygenase [Magnetovibrio sp.]|nr:TauD/TfdA family dioxygenase [Magnetovibrio sp.]
MPELRLQPVDDPAAWYGPDLAARDDWIHRLDAAETDELLAAVAHAAATAKPLREVERDDFPLPKLSARLAAIVRAVDHGAGLCLIKGVPVEAMSEDEAALALWGMGRHVGLPQPQDAAREVLHHVRDTGGKVEADPNLRIYQTNAEQAFHNDGGDLVMLLCRRPAKSGGASRMASAVTVFNEVLKREPGLAAELQAPFHFDARGQQLPGHPPVQSVPIYVWHADRLNALYKRPYIGFAQRFEDVPRLTEAQTRALDLVDALCDSPDINIAFELEPGDIQIASNFTIFHARDSFEDFDDPERRRHMLRLWLGLADGRPLPAVYAGTREFGPLFEIAGRD